MKILSTCSARPNFVKLAAVHHAMAGIKDMHHVIVHTGQHYDPLFSDIFFTQLSLPEPSYNLGVQGGDREQVIDMTMDAMSSVLQKEKPDIVLVYGDVNGALGVARAAKNLGVNIAHVEAGLRSFDLSMPEEINRMEIDTLSNLLFVSEQSGIENLQKEKCSGQAILVGNTMIDTLLRMLPLIDEEPLPMSIEPPFAIVTLHRPSNVDVREMLLANLEFLSEIAEFCPLLLPLHHRTKSALATFGLLDSVPKNVHIISPLGYIPFLRLLKESQFILTDSGGIQEEATLLQKRCFTLRKNTERPSTILSGSNVLIDISLEEDRATVKSFASHPFVFPVTIPEYWDGRAGERIVGALCSYFS